MTPAPSHSRLTTRPWFPLVPFMLVLFAAAVGIAGRMTAPRKHPRLNFLHSDDALADMEKEAALMKRAQKEFPFVVVDVLRLSERRRVLDEAGRLHPMNGSGCRLAPGIPREVIVSNTIGNRCVLQGFHGEDASVFYELAWRLHCDAKLLRERFYAFVHPGDRLQGLLAFSESLALANAEAAWMSVPPPHAEAIRSCEAAALLASHDLRALWWQDATMGNQYEPIHLQRAIDHLRKAENLTDWRQRPREWARIQGHIADCTALLGFGREAEEILHEAITAAGRPPGPEPPDPPRPNSRISVGGGSLTLDSEFPDPGRVLEAQLNTVLADRAPYAAVEAGIRRRLSSRTTGLTASSSGIWDGEVEERKVIANALFSQAKYAEAELWFRRFLPIHEHKFDGDIRDKLVGCTSLADCLEAQGKHAEAEKHYRQILAECTSTRGPEHHDTLRAARELARCLHAQQEKDAEALAFARLAADGWQKTLGAEHPRTVLAQELVKVIAASAMPALPPALRFTVPPRFR